MINFSLDIDGIEVVDRSFNRLDKIDDFRPVWPQVIEEFYSIEREQFSSEGAAGGFKWAPLSPTYREFKEVRFPGKPILQREGELVDSLTDFEAADSILRPLKDELIIGTKHPAAIYHQRGTRRGLPRRPPINLSKSQQRRLQKAIQAGLVQFVREATQ